MKLDFRPNLPKIVELLLYLAHKKPGADKYQAVKFFYLADREHINRYGRPITYEQYYALRYGPVASKTKSLLEGDWSTLREAKIDKLPFHIRHVQRHGPDKAPLVVLGAPAREVDTSLFSKSDLRVFDEILKKYGAMSFEDLFQLTHEHLAYRKAWGSRGSKLRSRMSYEDMIEDPERRKLIVENLDPIAAHV